MQPRPRPSLVSAGLALLLAAGVAHAQWVGKEAAEIALEETVQGPDVSALTLARLRGQVVYLEFWATWCSPCLASMPHLTELAREFRDQDLRLLLITDERRETIDRFLARRELPGFVVLDTDRSVFKSYGITGIPRSIIVDRDGTVVVDAHPTQVTSEMIASILDGSYRPAAPSAEPAPEAKAAGEIERPRIEGFIPGFDPTLNPYIKAGFISTEERPYTTLVRPAIAPDQESMAGFGGDEEHGVGVSMFGSTLQEIARFCVEPRSDKRLVLEGDIDQEKRWDVIVSRPAGWSFEETRDELFGVIRRMFDIEASERTVTVEALVPDLAHLRSDMVRRLSELDWENDPTARSFQPIDFALRMLENKGTSFVAFPDGGEDPLCIDMYGVEPWSMSAEELHEWLRSLGVRFSTETRSVTLTVLTR
jgi:thiol-disulfide isomerase/thioredoxin